MRGVTSVIVQTHQILRLPRKMNLMIDPCHTWNAIYNERGNKCHCPNSPNTAPATKNESHDWSLSHMKRYLQCAEQQVSLSKLTKYCVWHTKWLSWLILVTYETLFTMRGVTSVIVQTHQILRLPRKINLMIDPCHTWNAICNARSNMCHCLNSPNTAPGTQNDCHDWSSSHMKRYLQCAEQQMASSNITEYCACHANWLLTLSQKFLENYWNVISNAGSIREWSEHDPTMKPSLRNPPRNRGYFSRPPRAFCIEKYNISRSGYHSKLHRILRLPRKVTLQLHQILRLPRKMNLMIDPCHTWNAIYNARSNKCHCLNSPNTAPGTQNDWLSWLILVTYETLFTMCGTTDGILQHHRILRLPRKLTLDTFTKISRKLLKCHFQCGVDPRMIRAWSDHETVTPQPASQPRLLFTPTTSILYWKIQHFALRLSFQTSPNTAPATKSDTSTSPNTAPATKNESHDWSLSHMKRLQCAEQQVSLSKLTKYCAWHTKWLSWLILVTYETLFTMRGTTDGILQHHRILRLPRKLTLDTFTKISRKLLKCHFQCGVDPSMIREWSEHDPTMKPSLRNPPRNRGYFSRPPRAFCIEKYNISRSGYHSKLHRILRLPRKVTLQLHQILRLPRKMNLMIDPCHTWNAIYNARSNKSHCLNSPNTAPGTQNDCHDWSSSHMKRYLQCAEQQMASSNITEYCACHANWLLTLSQKFLENYWNVISNAGSIRAWSENDPSMIRPWNRHSATRLATEVTFHAHHEHFVLKNATFRAPAIIPNFTEYCACHEKWHFNFTKYCACHEKWISWLILVTHETLFTMRGATSVIV